MMMMPSFCCTATAKASRNAGSDHERHALLWLHDKKIGDDARSSTSHSCCWPELRRVHADFCRVAHPHHRSTPAG